MEYAEQLDVVRRVTRAKLKAQDAEDVAQEAMLRALRAEGQIDDPERRAPWLRTIARRQVAEFLRSSRPKVPSPPREADATPESHLLAAERAARVRRAVAALPTLQAAAATAFYLEGQDYGQIQRRLGLGKQAVAGRLFRARQSLRDALHDLRGGVAAGGIGARSTLLWNPLTQALAALVAPWAHARWATRARPWLAALVCVPLLLLMAFTSDASALVAAVAGAWLAEALVGAPSTRRIVALGGGAALLCAACLAGEPMWMVATATGWLIAHAAARLALHFRAAAAAGLAAVVAAVTTGVLFAVGVDHFPVFALPAVLFLSGLLLCLEALPARRLAPALAGGALLVATTWVLHPLLIEHMYR